MSIFIYLARAPRRAKGLSQPAKPARTSLYQRHNPHNPIQAGKAGEAQQQVKFFPQRPSRQSRRGHPFSSGILPISPPSRQSPQQVTSKLNYEAKPPLQLRQLKIDHFGVKPPASYQQVKFSNQSLFILQRPRSKRKGSRSRQSRQAHSFSAAFFPQPPPPSRQSRRGPSKLPAS